MYFSCFKKVTYHECVGFKRLSCVFKMEARESSRNTKNTIFGQSLSALMQTLHYITQTLHEPLI